LFADYDPQRCDAEPGALADYILALLKHNAPENDMRKEVAAQLDEFLEKGLCSAFNPSLLPHISVYRMQRVHRHIIHCFEDKILSSLRSYLSVTFLPSSQPTQR
jgi:hypothetical protein